MADTKPKTCETCKYRGTVTGACRHPKSLKKDIWVGAAHPACEHGEKREDK